MSESNGVLTPEEVEPDLEQEDETAPARLSRAVVQRERLKLASDMMLLFEQDLPGRVSRKVALLAARVVSDLAQLALEHGKK